MPSYLSINGDRIEGDSDTIGSLASAIEAIISAGNNELIILDNGMSKKLVMVTPATTFTAGLEPSGQNAVYNAFVPNLTQVFSKYHQGE